MSELVHIPAEQLDRDELVIVNDALREENAKLLELTTTAQALAKDAYERLEKRKLTDWDATKAQLGIQVTAAGAIYAIGAASLDGPFMAHPHLAIVTAAVSALVWCGIRTLRKYG